jgi:hypothetical protein
VPTPRDLAELPRFLNELTAAQDELESLLERQQLALAAPRADELISLAGALAEAVARVQRLLERRADMLARAAVDGQPPASLRQLALGGGSADRLELVADIDRLRAQGERLQKAGWRQWVAIQAAHRAHAEMLHLVARRGRPADGYDPNRLHGSPGTGGALLDASA